MKKITFPAMKKINTLLLALFLMIAPLLSQAQPAPPAPPPCPTNNPDRVGGGAMLEDGIQVFLGLIFLYGAYAVHKTLRRKRTPEHE